MNNNTPQARGVFIVFEGIDGSGKGTQILRAAKLVLEENRDNDVYITHEPTSHFQELKSALKNDAVMPGKQRAWWYARMFVTDRRFHVEKYVLPALEKGVHVLCDRYKYSTLAYQMAQGLDFDELLALQHGLPVPDLVIMLDCPGDVGHKRRAAAGALDSFDKDPVFLEQVRKRYLEISRMEALQAENIVVVDASQDVEKVFAEVSKAVRRCLENKKK